jgi:hypothetical protein
MTLVTPGGQLKLSVFNFAPVGICNFLFWLPPGWKSIDKDNVALTRYQENLLRAFM